MLSENISILKSTVSKTTYQGVGIAMASIVVSTLLLSYFHTDEISVEGILMAQRDNAIVWLLDCLPFIFAMWGQYSTSMIAHHAGAIIFDQTQALRRRTEELERHADNLEQQANYWATHDEVTDLPNKTLFYDRVEQEIIRLGGQRKKMAIMLIEIMNLKEINDTLGRHSSELVLKQVSTRVKTVFLGVDTIARMDGNVFGVMLPNIDSMDGVVFVVQKIQKALDIVFRIDRLNVNIHTNIGIVAFPEHGEDVDTLVQRAGVALFMASKTNEGYKIYDPSFDENSPRRLTLMSELRLAIEREELQLFYQPKVLIGKNEIYGAEALVRWIHPKHGFVSPEEFIPMAERTRVIKYLTAWVLRKAFQDCADWRNEGKNMTISVNLSAKDLHDPELPDMVAGVAAATGVDPEWIVLEITESSIMTDPDRTLEIINRLHEMGYKLSIDDFGTGYSSLGYLRKMPLAELKIDKSFVMDLLKSENDALIVKATIDLAHNLRLQVTAEGVENQEILEVLNGYSCDIAQGYHFSRPLARSDFDRWIESVGMKIKD